VSLYSRRSALFILLWALSLAAGSPGAQPAAAGAAEATTDSPAPVVAAEPAAMEPSPASDSETVQPEAALPAAVEPAPASDPEAAQADAATVPAAAAPEQESPPYSEEGADSCLKCHDEDDTSVPVLSIFKTKHGVQADARTPFAQLQCESCHGPGGEHAKRIRRDETRPPIGNFGKHATAPVEEQNGVCLDCHANHDLGHWPGSPHQRHDVPCAGCHSIHAVRDPALVPDLQPEVCLNCHKQQRAEIHKASTHPIRYGQMACTDCHAPHGSTAEALLKRATLNQTCYDCHAEKRGPFLWEHAPASEDCSLCHRSHGSNHPDLLTRRPPLLCQQCHSSAGHPSVQYTGRGLAGQQPSPRVLAGGCVNCHSQVHGSNHPSGADLNR
jgi:DmsE family decaheme c-type cytochrome